MFVPSSSTWIFPFQPPSTDLRKGFVMFASNRSFVKFYTYPTVNTEAAAAVTVRGSQLRVDLLPVCLSQS